MVQALTHGNEICGAIALDWLLQQVAQGWRPAAGTLTLAFANVGAYARFDPANPYPSRCVDEDYNRVWDDAELNCPARHRGTAPRAAAAAYVDEAELLLDIHSMGEPCRPLMVCGRVDKNAAYARELGVPGDLLIDTATPPACARSTAAASATRPAPRRHCSSSAASTGNVRPPTWPSTPWCVFSASPARRNRAGCRRTRACSRRPCSTWCA